MNATLETKSTQPHIFDVIAAENERRHSIAERIAAKQGGDVQTILALAAQHANESKFLNLDDVLAFAETGQIKL